MRRSTSAESSTRSSASTRLPRRRRRRHAAVLDPRAAREPAAQRGRQDRHARRHRGGRELGSRRPSRAWRSPTAPRACCCRTSRACRASSTSPPCARPSRRWAATPAHQSAAAGRPRHRSLGAGRQLRHAAQLRRERASSSSSATRSATSSSSGARARSRTSASCRRAPASCTRSTSSTSRPSCSRATTSGSTLAYPDTLVGTDSHTTMINGLGVLGWGVGGIEAEAAMLGQPVAMLLPAGDRLQAHGQAAARARPRPTSCSRSRRCCARRASSRSSSSSSATGSTQLSAARPRDHREHGARVRRDDGLLPGRRGDACSYLRFTGRSEEQVELVERTSKAQGLFRTKESPTPRFTDMLELDLATVVPSLAGPDAPAGPHRAHRSRSAPVRQALGRASSPRTRPPRARTLDAVASSGKRRHEPAPAASSRSRSVIRSSRSRGSYELTHGDVVIAAITSCTNTSNPSRADRRGPARQEGRRARASRPSPG